MIITKQLAIRIAKKLNAVIDTKSRNHDKACVYENDILIAHFGIRRGSKNPGHDHVPGCLYITTSQAKLLGQCPMSRADWLEVMRLKKML